MWMGNPSHLGWVLKGSGFDLDLGKGGHENIKGFKGFFKEDVNWLLNNLIIIKYWGRVSCVRRRNISI